MEPATSPVTSVPPEGRTYPWHRGIVATTFWVGETFDASVADGSQVCSTYDDDWALHWSGVDHGPIASDATACPGSALGGCDGLATGSGASARCATEARTVANGFFPTSVTPLENPFYLDLPFDDLNDDTGFATRCSVIPWAADPATGARCTDRTFSFMKNRWVRIVGPSGVACYGQIQDAGPSHDDLYHDAAYVFGADDRRPVQGQFNNAGADVSPAMNGCLGFTELDGASDHIDWQFVDDVDVPTGPWTHIVTTSQVNGAAGPPSGVRGAGS
jgi:hypothetical protein